MPLFQSAVFILIFLFSAIIHEISHGWMAAYLGDFTAKNAGRLTLNPIKHLEWFGSIILPGILILTGSPVVFGWAKPVPVNPLNFRDRKYGEAKVALAGPLSNIILALIFGLLIRFFPFQFSEFNLNLLLMFSFICWVNILLAIFNLIPIPPLDGSHILFALLPKSMVGIRDFLNKYGFIILLFFIFFLIDILAPIINFFFKLIVGSSFF